MLKSIWFTIWFLSRQRNLPSHVLLVNKCGFFLIYLSLLFQLKPNWFASLSATRGSLIRGFPRSTECQHSPSQTVYFNAHTCNTFTELPLYKPSSAQAFLAVPFLHAEFSLCRVVHSCYCPPTPQHSAKIKREEVISPCTTGAPFTPIDNALWAISSTSSICIPYYFSLGYFWAVWGSLHYFLTSNITHFLLFFVFIIAFLSGWDIIL